MKTILHEAISRGTTKSEGLKSLHSFSFDNYQDPNRLGFGPICLLNDDVFSPEMGRDTHSHSNMEIVSIPISGRLKQVDSSGRSHVIDENDIQVISSGVGISHSEFNDSSEETANFLQIWIKPDAIDVEAKYKQAYFSRSNRKHNIQLVVSPKGKNGSIPIYQQIYISLLNLSAANSENYMCYMKKSNVYLFIIIGAIFTGEHRLGERDGLGLFGVNHVDMMSHYSSEILIMEVEG